MREYLNNILYHTPAVVAGGGRTLRLDLKSKNRSRDKPFVKMSAN